MSLINAIPIVISALIASISSADTKESSWHVYRPKITKGAPIEAYCLQPGQEKGVVVNGDFDGNGVVNFDDYSLIDLAFNTQTGPV